MRKLPIDITLIAISLTISGIGLLCLYSASSSHISLSYFNKQLIWLGLGVLAIIIIHLVPVKIIFQSAYAVYALSIVSLLVVLFVSSSHLHRWIDFGPIHFQPSEFAKGASIIALARFLSKDRLQKFGWKNFLFAFILILIPILLIIKEPDMGTATVFVALFIGLVIGAGVSYKILLAASAPFIALIAGFHWIGLVGFLFILGLYLIFLHPKWWTSLSIVGICLGCGLIAPKIWNHLELYQQKRILIFLGLKSDPHGSAYQVIQSKVAVGSGGILGKGFLQGTQNQLRFLPEQHTDFIFSVLGEEFGFLGAILLLSLYGFLFMRMLYLLKVSDRRFGGFVILGVLTILAFQVFVNIGMTVGLAPVTGLPLPLMSYGGTSLLLTMIMIGLVSHISGQHFLYS